MQCSEDDWQREERSVLRTLQEWTHISNDFRKVQFAKPKLND